MKIEKNKVVTLSYELHASDDGVVKTFIEKTDNENPFVFIFGDGGLIPTFEQNVEGLVVGDTFSFSINADEAYGQSEKENIVDIPIDVFKQDGILMMDMLKIGSTLPMSDNEGNRMMGTILAITGDSVTMDFNHPLAGKNLHFTGSVVAVRDASPEELDHGHVHGEGGHHH
ncbi:MAG: peptidylprolyl isomerase [Bacteroidota bacterium]